MNLALPASYWEAGSLAGSLDGWVTVGYNSLLLLNVQWPQVSASRLRRCGR